MVYEARYKGKIRFIIYIIRLVKNLYIPNIHKIIDKRLVCNIKILKNEIIFPYQRVKVTKKQMNWNIGR